MNSEYKVVINTFVIVWLLVIMGTLSWILVGNHQSFSKHLKHIKPCFEDSNKSVETHFGHSHTHTCPNLHANASMQADMHMVVLEFWPSILKFLDTLFPDNATIFIKTYTENMFCPKCNIPPFSIRFV